MTQYWFSFTPNPATSAGLSPTFLDFIKFDGTTLAPPGITQLITGTGIYQFSYTPSFSIAFRIDGATTGLQTSQRYIVGNIEPNDELNNTLNAQGSTLVAIGNTIGGFSIGFLAFIGSTASIYGGASLEPVDLFGYLKWSKEFLSGNQSFNKTSGAWDIYSRNFATLLISKALTNDVSGVTRS